MGASTYARLNTRPVTHPMRNQSLPITQVRARSLRRGMTDSERKLWSGLRNEQLGVKFRRQHPLGHYIADFACLEVKLIVELDGSQHMDQTAHDTRRTEFFVALGFEVMRFPTDLPFTDLQALLACIYNRIEELAALAPIPAFPREGKE
jgi:very-short-patch-repair endonuclease